MTSCWVVYSTNMLIITIIIRPLFLLISLNLHRRPLKSLGTSTQTVTRWEQMEKFMQS